MVGTKRCFIQVYPIHFQIVLASTVFVIRTVIKVKPKGTFFVTYGTRKRYTSKSSTCTHGYLYSDSER